MVIVRCGNCKNEWEVPYPNCRPIFCEKCGATWIKANLVFTLPKKDIYDYCYLGPHGEVIPNKIKKIFGE